MTDQPTSGRGDRDDRGEADLQGSGSPGEPTLGPDASVRDIARAARAAFVGRDLLHSGPALWPFGARARARRDRNRQIAEEARRRRAQFRQVFDDGTEPVRPRPPQPWRPVDRRTNVAVVAALLLVVAGVFALALYFTGQRPTPEPAPGPAAGPAQPVAPGPVESGTVGSTAATSPTPRSAAVGFAPPPIPPGGVPAATARPRPPVDPAAVALLDPPLGPPSDEDLRTPEGAARAWSARWCPFTYTEAFGAAEDRARAAMTAAGWAGFDPRGHDGARMSWQKTVTAQESGRCGAPVALISPEAPRSDTEVIVIASITRVVTAPGRTPYAEPITQVRVVERGPDGRWRVDVETSGG